MTIFDMPHVFVVFPQGAGGNFLSGLLDKINSKNFSDVYVNNFGSAHVVNSNISISFGSTAEENSIFANTEEKENYYLSKINNDYSVPQIIVTWTHDFTNLPIYKKYFPNSKSLAISTFSIEEKLISTMMHVNKVILSDESNIPIPIEVWNKLKAKLKAHLSYKIENISKTKVDIDKIFEERYSQYNDLIFYLSTVILLSYGGLHDVLNELNEIPANTRNHRLMNTRELILKNSDVVLPYNYLINNDLLMLKNAISKIYNKELDKEETKFIEESFKLYREKQITDLLNDPISYFNFRKIKAKEEFKKIKNQSN